MAISKEMKRNAQLILGIVVEAVMINTIITGRIEHKRQFIYRDKDPVWFWFETGVFIILGIALISQAVKSFLQDKNSHTL